MPCLMMHGGGCRRSHGGSFALTLGKKSLSTLSSSTGSFTVGKRPLSKPGSAGVVPKAKRRKPGTASPQGTTRPARGSGVLAKEKQIMAVPGSGVLAKKQHAPLRKAASSSAPSTKSSASSAKSSVSRSAQPLAATGSGVLANGVRTMHRGLLSSALRPSAPRRTYMKIEHVEPGPVDETDAQHAIRHPTRHPGCVRCVYRSNRLQLERGYGSHIREESAELRCRTVWVAPRPMRMGGDFAVGCIFCADLRQRQEGDALSARRRVLGKRKFAGRPRYANTKWARFEMSNAEQLAPRGLRQHAFSHQHKVAVRSYFAPDVAVSSLEHEATDGDRELFRGGVPQTEDWLRAWRSCRTPQSFRAAEANGVTENFIKGSRIPGASRKAFKSMVRVMALVLRSRKLDVLKKAKAASVFLDDRKDFRIVSYRCCTSEPVEFWSSGVKTTSYVSTGRLAVLRRGGQFSEKELSDVDDDYSKAMATSVVTSLRRIAETPATGMADAGLVDRMCAAVRIGVADGASPAQKCLRFLAAGPFRNMLWAGRDRAHMVRISTSGPLLAEATFKAWWDDVFNERHALVPDIQNSEEWSARLELCQKVVLRSGVPESVDEHLSKVIKNFHIAKQRFDSMASPSLLYCALMVAVAMLLAYVSSDERAAPAQRARASRRLEEMPRHVITSGLSASYAGECIRFVRMFDTANHDPALTYRQKTDLVELLTTLFVEGRIWDSVGDGGYPTPLSLAWDTARLARPLYYGSDGKVLSLFRKPTPEHAQKLSDGMQAIAESSIKRLNVELSLDDLGVLFTSFDLTRWHAAREDMHKNRNDTKLQILQRHARAMFQAWNLDGSSGVLELTGMAFRLCAREETHLQAGRPRDNRDVWESVLSADFRDPNDRVATLLPMLEIYLAAGDSTCGIERDLSALRRILDAHKGPIDEDGATISYCTELFLDGPETEEGLATLVDDILVPTDFTRDCVRMWVSIHGRRFRVYSTRKGHSKAGKKGTFIALRKSVALGMANLAKKGKPTGDEQTIIGLPRSAFVRRPGQANPATSAPLMKKFNTLTNTKQAAVVKLAMARRMARGRRTNPYASPALNPNNRLRQGKGLSRVRLPPDGPSVRPGPGGRISCISCCREPAPDREGYRVAALELRSSGVQLLRSIRGAQLVILDSAWALDQVPHLTEVLMSVFLAIIALGKAVVPRARWHECTRGGPTGSKVVNFKKIYDSVSLLLSMSDKFKRELPLLTAVLQEIAKLPSSKWKLTARLDGQPGTHLDSRLDVRNLLLCQRRVSHQGCGLLGGAYFRSPRVA